MRKKLEIVRNDSLYLIQRDGFYQIHGMMDGKRIRKSCKTRDLRHARAALESLSRELCSGWRSSHDDPNVGWKEIAKTVYARQRGSARMREMAFDLTPGDIYALMKSTGFRCAVSGIPFSKRGSTRWQRDPWAPSVDRIENRHGYTKDNVRIVCLAANIAMSDWGYDVVLRLARGVVGSSSIVLPEPAEVSRHEHSQNANSEQVVDFAYET